MAVPCDGGPPENPGKKKGGAMNKEFLRWLRRLPAEERRERMKKIVSASVLGGTPGKHVLDKLQANVTVRLQRLDFTRGLNDYARHSRTSATSATLSEESVADKLPVPKKFSATFQRPCPLSRKRRSTEYLQSETKQMKIVNAPNENQAGCTQLLEAERLSESSSVSEKLEKCRKDITNPESLQGTSPPKQFSDDIVVVNPRSKSPLAPAVSPQNRSTSQMAVVSAPTQAETLSTTSEATPQTKQILEVGKTPATNRNQPPILTARMIDSEIADVALAIAATEKELASLHERLISAERHGSSLRSVSTINILLESAAILENKSKCVKSCVDKGVMRKLGSAFYPRLLQEVQKNQKLNLYSNMRLMSMVNMLLGLSLPNSDPRHTLSAFVAKSLYDQRPIAQNTAEDVPCSVPSKLLKVPANPVTNGSQALDTIIEKAVSQNNSSQPPGPAARVGPLVKTSVSQHSPAVRGSLPVNPVSSAIMQPRQSATNVQLLAKTSQHSQSTSCPMVKAQVVPQHYSSHLQTPQQVQSQMNVSQVTNLNPGGQFIVASQSTLVTYNERSAQPQSSSVQPSQSQAQYHQPQQVQQPPQLQLIRQQPPLYQQNHQPQIQEMQLYQREQLQQQRQIQQQQQIQKVQQIHHQQQQIQQVQQIHHQQQIQQVQQTHHHQQQIHQQLQRQPQQQTIQQQPPQQIIQLQPLQQQPLQQQQQQLLQQRLLQQQPLQQNQLLQQRQVQQQHQQLQWQVPRQVQQQHPQQLSLQSQLIQQQQQLSQQVHHQFQHQQVQQIPFQQQQQQQQYSQHLILSIPQQAQQTQVSQYYQQQPQKVVSYLAVSQAQERRQPAIHGLPGGAPLRQADGRPESSYVQVIANVSPVARATSRDSGIASP